MTTTKRAERWRYLPPPNAKARHDCADSLPRLLRPHMIPEGSTTDTLPLAVGGPPDAIAGTLGQCGACQKWSRLAATAISEFGLAWSPRWVRLRWWNPVDWPSLLRIGYAGNRSRYKVTRIVTFDDDTPNPDKDTE